MRKLIGRAGPLLIFAPSRVAGGGGREAEVRVPGPREQEAAAPEGAMTRTDPERFEPAAPSLAERLEQAVAATFGRWRGPSPLPAAAVEDLWDPAGVPGPLEIAIASRAQRVAWWLRAGGRR